jgi:putative ABC transport system permease protein
VLRASLKSAWGHKRRLLSTAIAVVLGVAFMAGTLVLGDTLDRSFEQFFGEALSETDAVVRGPELIDTGFGTLYGPIDEEVMDLVAGVEGADYVAGNVQGSSIRVLGADGEPIGSNTGPPTLMFSWIDDTGLSGLTVVEGRGPEADDEIAMNLAAVTDAGFTVGDQVDILLPDGIRTFTLVGTYQIGGRDSALGTVNVSFTLPTSQEIAGIPGQVTEIVIRTDDPDLDQEELAERIREVLPPEAELDVLTGEAYAEETSDDLSQGFGFFTTLLLVFAYIALIVGAFIIFNTFSILVAQRSKELALMRAIGASRRQVMTSVLVEAVLVGLFAAVVGVGAGVLLATGALALLDSIGLDLPTNTVSVTSGAVINAIVTGTVVTVGSALVPAWRATRVPPLAALRDVSLDRSGHSRIRLVLGLVLLALAVVISLPAFGDDPDATAIRSVGLGALALLVSLVVLGPVIARPLARALGWPLPRLRGTTGQLARENAARSPKRTASTAAALMIGVGLIVFINVFTASARASIDVELKRGLQAELIVQPSGFDVGAPPAFAADARGLDGVAAVATVQGWFARFEEPGQEPTDTFIQAVVPDDFDRAVDVRMVEGDLSDLVPGTIAYDRRVAEDVGLSVGDEVTITFASGRSETFTVSAISDDPQLFGLRVIHKDDFTRLSPAATDFGVFVLLDDGADLATVRADLEELAEPYPTLEILDQEEYLGSVAETISAVLNVVYGLLALSVVIALIGIANTLSLSIHERTRELGLLRAVGMTRAQMRSAVRWESVIISLIGVALGVGLGLVTSYALIQALKADGLSQYSLPVQPLVVIAVIFGALGVAASLLPSRRAARLDVLEAIATE